MFAHRRNVLGGREREMERHEDLEGGPRQARHEAAGERGSEEER